MRAMSVLLRGGELDAQAQAGTEDGGGELRGGITVGRAQCVPPSHHQRRNRRSSAVSGLTLAS